MAQLDAAGGEHAIDIEAGRPTTTSDCAVCMEPAEWVAVGPCGHREVCASCAVRMRFFDRNRRCCMCRAFCPIVVITKAGSTAGHQQAQAQGDAALSKPPLTAGDAGAGKEVGRCLLYHGGVAAYFDNPDQNEKAREMCLRLSSPPPHPDDYNWALVLLGVVVNTLFCLGTGLPFAMGQFEHWRHRVLFTLGFGFIGGAFTYLYLSWNLHRDDGPES